MSNSDETAESMTQKVKGFLEKPMRVMLIDGRVVTGNFQCLDRETNIILSNAIEYYDVKEDLNLEADLVSSRHLGLTVIPGKNITRCEAQVN